jgi:hypothetical protein
MLAAAIAAPYNTEHQAPAVWCQLLHMHNLLCCCLHQQLVLHAYCCYTAAASSSIQAYLCCSLLQARPQVVHLWLLEVLFKVAGVTLHAVVGGLRRAAGASVDEAFFAWSLCLNLGHDWSLLVCLLQALDVTSVPDKQQQTKRMSVYGCFCAAAAATA